MTDQAPPEVNSGPLAMYESLQKILAVVVSFITFYVFEVTSTQYVLPGTPGFYEQSIRTFTYVSLPAIGIAILLRFLTKRWTFGLWLLLTDVIAIFLWQVLVFFLGFSAIKDL